VARSRSIAAMKRHRHGYTLIELMIAITLLSILVGLAVPTFREFTRNNSMVAAQNDLVTALNMARSEALRRNRAVSVCASADGTSCGDETNWNTGWIAFTDGSTPGVIDGTDVSLQTWQTANTNVSFNSGGSSFAQYLPTGMSAGAVTIDISWTGCAGLHTRRVAVTLTGSVRGTLVACS
jgi:type IV fimbrial biogenesis protein FimT